MKLYKVLKRQDGKLVSAATGHPLSLEYVPGEVTWANDVALALGYGITCFREVEQAKHFMLETMNPGTAEIWEVDTLGHVWEPKVPAFSAPAWMYDYNCIDWGWPDGTLMTTGVYLIKRIFPNFRGGK